MRFAKIRESDSGSAIVEFVVVVVLIMIPIAYIVVAAMRIQAASYASAQAVREAGRAFVQSDSPAQARHNARVAARIALNDQGFELPDNALTFACTKGGCLDPESLVTVNLNWRVYLPLLPASLDDAAPASVKINTKHVAYIDRYRSD